MYKKWIKCLVLLLFAYQTVIAQNLNISGKITDESGSSLPGVNIIEKGTSNGTTSDPDGNYMLKVQSNNSTLVFSYIGFVTEEALINNRSTINITLIPDIKSLQEVVVVGYGQTERKKLTTSVASVSSKQIEDLPVANLAQTFAGQVAGVFVQQGSGQPGAAPVLRIRGFGSVNAGSEPLYVIDGYVCPDASLFNSLNPAVVERVEILKDAAAGAIYGSRAGNGVVIVTTKRGKEGKTQFSLNASTGFSRVINKIDMMNREQYIDLAKDALNNSGLAVPDILLNNPENLPDTDWQDAIFKNAPFKNYQIAASGGTEKISFFFSGNYLNQDGIVRRSGYEIYSANANVDAKLSKKLNVGFSFIPSYSRTQTQPTAGSVTGGGGYGGVGGIIQSALAMVPIIPVRLPNGDYGQVRSLNYQGFAIDRIYNPVATLEGINDITKQVRMIGRSYLDYELFNGLKVNVSFGGTLSSAYRSIHVGPYVAGEGSLVNTSNISNPQYGRQNASQQNEMATNWLFESYLTYDKTLNDVHHLKADVGYSTQRNNFFATGANSSINDRGSANASNPLPAYTNDYVPNINGASLILGNGSLSEYTFISYFARLNYDFKGKYLFQASMRRDGSSKFAPNNRYGTFPAISAAWRIIEEPFMQSQSLLTDLKLKASYGISGNDQIGNYGWLGRENINANYSFANGTAQGIAKSSYENRSFKWETNTQVNIGLEAGFFKDRLSVNVDVYKRVTDDMILSRPLPTENGVTGSVLANVGTMENKGIELGINTRNSEGAFSWTSGLFLSINRNKVTKLVGGRPINFGAAGYETTGAFASMFRYAEGRPIGDVYGYNVIGIFNNQAEFDAYPKFGNSTVGNVKFEDVEPDGDIDANDIIRLGNVLPDFTYGITNSFSYKGFDLNIVIDGVQGSKLVNPVIRQLFLGRAFENSLASLANRYRSPDDIGSGEWGIAKQNITGGVNQPTSQYLFDSSYLRFRNITLGYTIPEGIVQKIKVQNSRVYVSAQNWFTITNYFGYSPEANNYNGAAGGAQLGVDMGAYPLAKTLTFGLNIGF